MIPNDKDICKSTLTVSIASSFNYKESEDKTYFQIPSNLNQKLRDVTVGRPNASVEILVKYLYQSKHCSNSNRVEYSLNRLSDIMNLHRYAKNNNYSRIKKTLNKAFDTCKALGIISKIEKGKNSLGEPKYIFYFN